MTLFTLMLAVGPGSVARADTLVVSQEGKGDYDTLSDALLAASSGDTVFLGPGEYSSTTGEFFPLYLPAAVSIIGDGPDTTILNGEGEYPLIVLPSGDLTLEDVTLRGAYGEAAHVETEATLTLSDVRIEEGASDTTDECALFCEGQCSVFDVVLSENYYPALRGADTAGMCSLWGVVEGEGLTVEAPEGETIYVGIGDSAGLETGSMAVSDVTIIGGSMMASWEASIENALVLGGCLAAGDVNSATVVGCDDSGVDAAISGNRVTNSIASNNDHYGILALTMAAGNLLQENSYGNWQPDYDDWSGSLRNIEDEDPLFRDYTDDDDWTNDDLRLSEGSPAIDSATGDAPSTDLDGTARPQDGDGDGEARNDMGAYEWGLIDYDGDGWYAEEDCDDTDPDINPGEQDIPYDGIDQDCDGEDLIDYDGDGYDADHQGGEDCDDTDEQINPGAYDVPGNGIDEDCDGEDASDLDGDGWGEDLDCDDEDADIHPGVEESCDGVDQDCDEEVDEDACEEVGACTCAMGGSAPMLPALMWPALVWWLRRRQPSSSGQASL